jgi:hypothetical protein
MFHVFARYANVSPIANGRGFAAFTAGSIQKNAGRSARWTVAGDAKSAIDDMRKCRVETPSSSGIYIMHSKCATRHRQFEASRLFSFSSNTRRN